MSVGRGLVALGLVALLVAGFAYAVPFMMGFQNIIGLLASWALHC